MRKFGFLLIGCILLSACSTNYFQSSQTQVTSDVKSYQKIQLGQPLDSISLYLMGDYKRFQGDKELIWINQKDLSQLITSKIKSKPDYQVLFTFNDISEFNNTFGFYYENLSNELLKEKMEGIDFYRFHNGIQFFYPFLNFQVVDTFLEKGSGQLRFLSVNRPNYAKDPHQVYYYDELNKLFFTINSPLFQELEEDKSFESTPYGNYLKYYESIKDTTGYGKQMKANALSFLGDLYSRNRLISQVFNYQNRKPFEISDDFQPQSAKEFILQQSKDHQVVMFNENHMNPENRIFLAQLLSELRKQGFKTLAVEALSTNDSSFIENVPTQMAGYYTREPEFGNLLRKAKELGFEILPYENTLETDLKGMAFNNFRDSIQAENLKTIFEKNNRMIVLAGHSHIEEKQKSDWKMMAQRFYEITNVNPLTIEQAIFSNLGSASWRNNVSERISEPTVMVNKDGKIWTVADGYFDIQVFFPSKNDWINENRIAYTFDYRRGLEGNIIHIYNETDVISNRQIPIAVQEIYSNENNQFYLPEKGIYQLVVLSPFGQVLYGERINLE